MLFSTLKKNWKYLKVPFHLLVKMVDRDSGKASEPVGGRPGVGDLGRPSCLVVFGMKDSLHWLNKCLMF